MSPHVHFISTTTVMVLGRAPEAHGDLMKVLKIIGIILLVFIILVAIILAIKPL